MSWWYSRSKTSGSETEAEDQVAETDDIHPAAAQLLQLQRDSGNQAVQQLINSSNAADLSPPQSEGQPLPQETLEQMQTKLGESFDDVRVHIDEEAARTAAELGANAYTHGRDIYFARGKYAPNEVDGQRLLAHELTHVVQQHGASATGQRFQNQLSMESEPAEREAKAAADQTVLGHHPPTVAFTGVGIQRDVGWARRGPLPDPYGTLLLLNAFAAKFLDAARLILRNPAAMTLVNEAEAAGIQFGGYSEDGPGSALGRAYTIGTSVYVPRARTDPIMAMKSFLFELNNALRASRFAALDTEAAKGSTGTLTARQFAYQTVELEVEGMLRLGEIWFTTRRSLPAGTSATPYDAPFYLPDYEAVRSGRKSKADLVREVLSRVYDSGTLRGKTVEQYYIEMYNRLSGGR